MGQRSKVMDRSPGPLVRALRRIVNEAAREFELHLRVAESMRTQGVQAPENWVQDLPRLLEPVRKSVGPGDVRDAARRALDERFRRRVADAIARHRVEQTVRGLREAVRDVGGRVEPSPTRASIIVTAGGSKREVPVIPTLTAESQLVADKWSMRLQQDLEHRFDRVIQKRGNVEDAVRAARDVFPKYSDSQAELLGRDQWYKATKRGKQMFGEQFGDAYDREWVAHLGPTGDGHNRSSHLAMHGQRVGMHEPWTVNYALDDPRLPSAVQELLPGDSRYGIMCRCDVRFVARQEPVRKAVVDAAEHALLATSPRARTIAHRHGSLRGAVEAALHESGGSRSAAARSLGVSKPTLYAWVSALNVPDSDVRHAS